MYPIPTQAEQDKFLLGLYFGSALPLRACVDRAYLDFCRTLRGIDRLPMAAELRDDAGAAVQSWLDELRGLSPDPNRMAFDARHRDQCERLCALYAGHGFDSFAVGQAQKWLNMALKYVYVFGEERLPGFSGLYRLGHVPLDNIILAQLAPRDPPPLPHPWSRIQDYDAYLRFQHWIHEQFPDSAPLAVEFHLWQKGNDRAV
jgi:hypothetical protein